MDDRQFSQRVQAIQPFHVMELLARAQALEAQGRNIIHMEVGEPDFATPPLVVEAAQRHLAGGQVRYTPAAGLPALREAIALWYAERFGASVAPERILITAGASGALMLALACLTDPGQAWLLTDPGYPCNRELVRAFNGIPASLTVGRHNAFQPTLDEVSAAWTPHTRGMILASPANPTGCMLAPAALDRLAQCVRERDGALIVDEIYQGLVYDDAASTILTRRDDVFVTSSFSKYFGMTGWRLGWLVVPSGYARAVEMLSQHYYIAASTPAQHAALAAFAPATLDLLEARRLILRERRDHLLAGLRQLGWRIDAQPAGAFYLYADISEVAENGSTLANRLLEEGGVAITPGLDFGSYRAEAHVRLAYTTDVARIDEALSRIASVLKA